MAEQVFIDQVWEALKGDHTDLRKQAIILRAFRDAHQFTPTPAREEVEPQEAIVISLIYDDGEHEPHEACKEAVCLTAAAAHAFIASRYPEARRIGDDELAGYQIVINGEDMDMTLVLWSIPLWSRAAGEK